MSRLSHPPVSVKRAVIQRNGGYFVLKTCTCHKEDT